MNLLQRIKCFVLAPLLLTLLTVLSACITVGPDFEPSKATVVPNSPDAWSAKLPHGGSLSSLTNWWAQFDDPLLTELIAAAQTQSTSMADAALKIAQARALLVTANATMLPVINGQASASRGTTMLGGPIVLGTTTQAQLQANWELDLFGGLRRANDAATARLAAEVAGWHAARISVAADTANYYTNYRACEQLAKLATADARSRDQTASLTEQLATTGFQAPANASLARASAAEGAGRAVAQQAECDLIVKAVVAITGFSETDLRHKLAKGTAKLPEPQRLTVKQIPAEVIAQRPDVAALEMQLAAANADIGVRIAERLPKISLSGNIGPLNFSYSDGSINGSSWTVGPVVTMPIFDAGRRYANEQTAWVAYETVQTKYRNQVRAAVREVEEALVRLDSMREREVDAIAASKGYHVSLNAAEEKYRFGLSSVLDLEETRRLSFNADNILTALQRDHVNAWIALYRAVGGGWDASENAQPPNAFPNPELVKKGNQP